MKKDRRLFLNRVSLMAGATILSKPLSAAASVNRHINPLRLKTKALTVYSTNDMHGQLRAGRNGMGGLTQITSLVAAQPAPALLVDGGDFLHSSQSLSQQQTTIYQMNAAGYHAATIGNHELAAGQAHLASLVPLMQFNLVNCNYELDAVLSPLVKPYVIRQSGALKIGITGVGHPLDNVIYHDAVTSANRVARLLKEEQHCDIVICLSHLGLQHNSKLSNRTLAAQSEHIDLIISGHNQHLLNGPLVLRNKKQHDVVVSQSGWDGLVLGKTEYAFNFLNERIRFDADSHIPGQPEGYSLPQLKSNLNLLTALA